MKSIQAKFIILISGCIPACSTVIGGAGILSTQQVMNEDAAQSMNLRCSESAKQTGTLLPGIEQSVKTLTVYTDKHPGSMERLKHDDVCLEGFTEQLESMTASAANNTERVTVMYARYNPKFTPPTSGLFQSKTDLSDSFRRLTSADFSKYSPSDTERVGRYYIPVRNGETTWIAPYNNESINLRMIPYMIPIYKGNGTIGVAEMDIDFTIIRDLVSSPWIYEGGYVFLTDGKGNVMYHNSYPSDISVSSVDESLHPLVVGLGDDTGDSGLFSYLNKDTGKKMAFRMLHNGMWLVVVVPMTEINRNENLLLVQILVSPLVIISLALMVTVIATRRMVKPLKELNTAAKKTVEGDLSISLTTQTKDEVGTLANSLQQTVNHLRKYINYINSPAYRDAPTGVKNEAAFQEAERQLEKQMRRGRPGLVTVALDTSSLKLVNDHFGHDFEDMLTMDACKIICKSFTRSSAYRVGGGEFAVILGGADYANYVQLPKDFQQAIVEYNENSRGDTLTIARGITIYNSGTGLVFFNVSKHTDDTMYQNKADMRRGEPEAREKRK